MILVLHYAGVVVAAVVAAAKVMLCCRVSTAFLPQDELREYPAKLHSPPRLEEGFSWLKWKVKKVANKRRLA